MPSIFGIQVPFVRFCTGGWVRVRYGYGLGGCTGVRYGTGFYKNPYPVPTIRNRAANLNADYLFAYQRPAYS